MHFPGQNWKSKSSYEKLLSEDLKECEMRAHYILGTSLFSTLCNSPRFLIGGVLHLLFTGGIYNPDHPKEACEHYMRSHILGYKKAEFAYCTSPLFRLRSSWIYVPLVVYNNIFS